MLLFYRTCGSPNSEVSNLVENELPNTNFHLDKAHTFERICSETQKRRKLNLGQKCSEDFDLFKNEELNSINIKRKSTGETFLEDKFCIGVEEGQLEAEICREIRNRGPTA